MTLYTKQGTRYKPTTLSEQGAWGWEDLMVIAAFRDPLSYRGAHLVL